MKGLKPIVRSLVMRCGGLLRTSPCCQLSDSEAPSITHLTTLIFCFKLIPHVHPARSGNSQGGIPMARIIMAAALALAVTLPSVQAQAQNGALTRSFVSSAGVDSNPCTITQPCATFAQAYTKFGANGIIAALDPGKYGPITITGPLTVNGNGWAAITGPAQGNGITVNAVSGNVILTGLEVDGAGAAYNGIVFNTGDSLTVTNCIVKDFISANGTSGNGIMIAPTSGTIDFTIVNTIALNNGSAGIHYLPASGSATAIGSIDHLIAANNANGIAVDLSAASGGSAAVTISNSAANNNTASGIVTASTAAT